jgi:hypothetical protein
MANDEPDLTDEKRLCHRCVGESYLRKEIALKGTKLRCSYCGTAARTYSIGDLVDRVETAFEQHYTRTFDQPTSWQQTLLSDRESTYDWQRDGEPVVDAIMNAADMPEDAARDIQQILDERHGDFDSVAAGEETDFADDSHYEEKGQTDGTWGAEWSHFEHTLKTEARFFSQSAAAHLASVFEGLDTLKTREGRTLVAMAGPGTPLTVIHRARVFQSPDDLKVALCRPDNHLGSPPPQLANAGRMNARGISVFYGATEPSVALAEVRPPVASHVVVARFDIITPLRLLDLTALSDVHLEGSIFDPDFAARLERAMFLRSLSQRISRPVLPNDEAFEYLPTQAVADFLASQTNVPLDGIIFPSVQARVGLNVVLFHQAARVETLILPPGTKLTADLGHSTDEDEWEPDYSVTEEVPPPAQVPAQKAEDQFWPLEPKSAHYRDHDHDSRAATLRVVPNGLTVHFIRAVEIKSDTHTVSRHRWEQTTRADF